MDIKTNRRSNRIDAEADTSFCQHPSIDKLIHAFLLHCRNRNLSARSIEFYESCLTYVQKVYMNQKLLLDLLSVTANDFQQHVVGYMVDQKLAPNTINGRIKTCKVFFAFLFREHYREQNIAEGLVLLKCPKNQIQTFSNAEMLQLLRQPDQTTFTGFRDYTMMIILLDTGIRIAELLSLTLKDVNLKEKELRIRFGKGQKARNVPFQKTCAKVLQSYIQERRDVTTDALFITLENAPLQIRTVQERIKDYGKMAQIHGVRVSPHTFRHSMAKLYIRNGGDPFSLQQILGHSSLDMIHTYVQLFSNEVREQHKKYSPVEHMKL
jgi:integrase/recombinase XerD